VSQVSDFAKDAVLHLQHVGVNNLNK